MGYSEAQNQVYQVQQAVQKTAVEGVDKFEHLVRVIGETIGWGWVFALVVIGGFVAIIVIFKRQVKKILGDWIKVLNDIINK